MIGRVQREVAGGLGVLRAAVPIKTAAPDRIHNNWAWLVGGLLAGLAVHTVFDIWSSRLLAVGGALIALIVGDALERTLIHRSAPYPRGGRKAFGVTDSHFLVFRRPGIGGRALHVIAAVPSDDVNTIRVDNGGWDWLRWLLTFSVLGALVISEFLLFSPDLILVGAIVVGLLAAVIGSTVTSSVWVSLGDGRQWKFRVRSADWYQFHSMIPGFKWRGSGDGMREGIDDGVPWSVPG